MEKRSCPAGRESSKRGGAEVKWEQTEDESLFWREGAP